MLNVVLHALRRRVTMNLLGASLSGCLILPLQAAAANENPAQLAESKTVKLNPLPLDHGSPPP